MNKAEQVRDKRTKIVCTIGPGTDGAGVLERMIAAGMNVARFNFSHGTHEEHGRRMQAVREAAETIQTRVALLLDTKGPEMRVGTFRGGEALLQQGEPFDLCSEQVEGNSRRVTISHPGLWRQIAPGQSILLADGLVRLLVKDVNDGCIETEIENTGIISDRKRVACPGLPILLPPLSAEDIEDIRFGLKEDIDYIAASFIQRADDVVEIKRFLEKEGAGHVRVLAKIENEEGVRNLDSILHIADGLMVARGDLGVEIPPERVPMLQKEMICICNTLGKPVITATQMLESMISNPRPTRAETSDIANAILDGTDAVMLSGETANGKYPVAAVETMLRVALSTEQSEMYRKRVRKTIPEGAVTTEAISHSTVHIAEALEARAILTSSETGRTALMVSKYRPHCPIIMISPHERSLRRATLYWGVLPLYGKSTENSDEMVEVAMQVAAEKGIIDDGDLAVITAGVPIAREGTTNMIRVQVAGKALVRGIGLGNGRVVGQVRKAISESLNDFNDGDILVVQEMLPELVPYAERAAGIIAEERGYTCASAIMGLSLDKPTIIAVRDVMKQFKDSELITVDAVRGLIFRGEVNAR